MPGRFRILEQKAAPVAEKQAKGPMGKTEVPGSREWGADQETEM